MGATAHTGYPGKWRLIMNRGSMNYIKYRKECKYYFWINSDWMAEGRPIKNVEVNIKDETFKVYLIISASSWSRITNLLGLSTTPNIIGKIKLSKYIEQMPQEEYDLIKLESVLEGLK